MLVEQARYAVLWLLDLGLWYGLRPESDHGLLGAGGAGFAETATVDQPFPEAEQ
jgi:hypothetical protein